MTFTVHAFGDTNKGLFREVNEDNLMVGRTIFAVADGMGGHAAGEVASAAALQPLQGIDGTTFRDPEAASEALADAVREANEVVIDRSTADPELRGMGTTLTTVMVRGRRLHLAHVGDSRAYLLRDGMLDMLTEDHTLVNELVKEGRLTEEQAATHPQRSVITRAIGVERGIEVDVMQPLELRPGDQVLLCSDGLTGPVSESLIAEILGKEADGNIACQRLIDAANAGGGPDNITCVLLRVEGDGAAPTAPAEVPRITSDDDATAELGDPAALSTASTSTSGELDAARLSELADGDPDLAGTPSGHVGDTEGPSRGRRIAAAALGVLLILAVVVGGTWFWISNEWFVGADEDGTVGIYQGIRGDLLGIPLNRLAEEQAFTLEDLPEPLSEGLQRDADQGLRSFADAQSYIRNTLLPAIEEAQEEATPAPTATPSPSPTPTATPTARGTPDDKATPGPVVTLPPPADR